MSGGTKWAKPALGRPLDGGVRRQLSNAAHRAAPKIYVPMAPTKRTGLGFDMGQAMSPTTTRKRQTVAATMSQRCHWAGLRDPRYRNSTARNGAYSAVLPWARTSLASKWPGSGV